MDIHNKAMEEIVEAANKAWSWGNETLFHHVLDYEGKLNTFLNKVGGWIREQEERVWTTSFSNSGGHWGTSLCLPRHSIPSS